MSTLGLGIGAGWLAGPFLRGPHQLLQYKANIATPVALPPAELAVAMYRGGLLGGENFIKLALSHGINILPADLSFEGWQLDENKRITLTDSWAFESHDWWEAALRHEAFWPNIDNTMAWLNRGVIDIDTADRVLHRNGVSSFWLRQALLTTRFGVPTISGAAALGQRNLFVLDPLPGWNLQAEKPAQYTAWARAAGGGPIQLWDPKTGARLPEIDTSDQQWSGHWQWPNIQELLNLKWRLRPKPLGTENVSATDGCRLPEGLEEYLWRVNGVHPGLRQCLEAANRPVVSIRHLRMLLEVNAINRDQLIAIFMDQHYNQAVAETLADANIRRVQITQQQKAIGEAKGQFAEAYELGFIDENTYAQLLFQMGLTDEQVGVALFSSQWKQELNENKEMLKFVRTQYLKGKASNDEVRQALTIIGVQPDRIQRYINIWSLEFVTGEKEISAGQAISFAGEGLLPLDDVPSILDRLGYSPEAQDLLTGQALFKLEQTIARAVTQEERQLTATQKALESAIKRSQHQIGQLQRALAKRGAPGKLIVWWKQGLISSAEVVERLTALGYPPADIERMITSEVLPKPKPGKGGEPPTPPSLAEVAGEAIAPAPFPVPELEGIPPQPPIPGE